MKAGCLKIYVDAKRICRFIMKRLFIQKSYSATKACLWRYERKREACLCLRRVCFARCGMSALIALSFSAERAGSCWRLWHGCPAFARNKRLSPINIQHYESDRQRKHFNRRRRWQPAIQRLYKACLKKDTPDAFQHAKNAFKHESAVASIA